MACKRLATYPWHEKCLDCGAMFAAPDPAERKGMALAHIGVTQDHVDRVLVSLQFNGGEINLSNEEQPERRLGRFREEFDAWGISAAELGVECDNPECWACSANRAFSELMRDPVKVPTDVAAMSDDEVRQAASALTGYPVPTPRERAEEKVRLLLNEDAPTKALAFTMLRAEGMDSDKARMILRDAKWNLP